MIDCCPIQGFVLYTCCKLLHGPASGDKLLACEPTQHEQGLLTQTSFQTNVNDHKTILWMQKGCHCSQSISRCCAAQGGLAVGKIMAKVKVKLKLKVSDGKRTNKQKNT